MLSVILTICTAVLLLAGIGYAVYELFPYVVNTFNAVTEITTSLSSILPPWLVPLATVAVAVAVIGLVIKLLSGGGCFA